MKISDAYRKFLEENKNELRTLLIECAKAIRDSTEELPEDELIAAWKSCPIEAGYIYCEQPDDSVIFFSIGTESWTYQFDDGNSLLEVLEKYIKNHYSKDFSLSGAFGISVSEEGVRITYEIYFESTTDSEPFQKLANDLKECLSTYYEVNIGVYEKAYYIELTWFFK